MLLLPLDQHQAECLGDLVGRSQSDITRGLRVEESVDDVGRQPGGLRHGIAAQFPAADHFPDRIRYWRRGLARALRPGH
jgi:hypothetical protein